MRPSQHIAADPSTVFPKAVAPEIHITRKIVKLLQQTTNLSIVSSFLKQKGLNHSAGSWEDMLEKRLIPQVIDSRITNDELVELLRSAEECGKQHIFLYNCKNSLRTIQLIDRTRVAALLRKRNLEGLLTNPVILEEPTELTLVDVRWEKAAVDLSLTLKMVEPRKTSRLVRTETDHLGMLHKVYAEEEQRVVHVAKLHRNGLLELRIAARTNSSKYENEISRAWSYFESFFPFDDFKEVSLSKAKLEMWNNRERLGDLVRYSDATVRDEHGNVLRALNGSPKVDLSTGKAVSGGLDYTLKNDQNAYCEASNLRFKQKNTLSGDIHVLLSGQINEFALPSNCTVEDHQYVIEQLIHFNK